MTRTLTDDERIASIREVLYAAHGDWHELTNLWSVCNDLDWLLERAVRVPDPLREALEAVVRDYRNEASVIHYSREGGFHEGPEWRDCISVQCARMRAAIVKAESALGEEPHDQ